MSRPSEVLLVVEQLRRRVPGGIGSMIRGLLKGLGSQGAAPGAAFSVTLYASRAPRRPDELEQFGRPVVQCALPGPIMTRAWDRGLLDVPKDFDVVHALSLVAPPARNAALAVTVHDMTWRRLPEAFPRRGRRWHEASLRRVMSRAAVLVVPSEPVARDLLTAGASEGSVEVIPLGCDHLPPPDLDAAEELLGGLGVGGEYLLSVGTLEPRKNLPRLLEAYGLARPRLPEAWPLVLVGPGGWGPGVVPGPGVVLAGSVSEATLAALYRRARLLAYVPLLEGFGLPPLEAMREGTPVVASRVPSVGDSTMEVDPRNVDDIADALVTVASDEKVRRQLVSAGLARAAELTWANNARRHLELWASLG